MQSRSISCQMVSSQCVLLYRTAAAVYINKFPGAYAYEQWALFSLKSLVSPLSFFSWAKRDLNLLNIQKKTRDNSPWLYFFGGGKPIISNQHSVITFRILNPSFGKRRRFDHMFIIVSSRRRCIWTNGTHLIRPTFERRVRFADMIKSIGVQCLSLCRLDSCSSSEPRAQKAIKQPSH